jgi:predicted dehydrogenase
VSGPISFGLVGAGPWAEYYHGPLLSTGPETRLDVVWARRPEQAEALAARFGARAVATYEELLDACEAVAFTVPPDVQASLAARAGKHLLIEKPVGFTVEQGEALAAALNESGAVNMLMLTNRFSQSNAEFIERASALDLSGGTAVMVAGAILPGARFATPWRLQRGVLVDNGPHILDLLDSAFGPLRSIAAQGDPSRWISLITEHENGALVSVSLSLTVDIEGFDFGIHAYGRDGAASVSKHFDHDPHAEPAQNIRREFAAAVASGRPHRLDVNRGLYLQRWIAAAERSLAGGGAPTSP